MPAGAAMQGKPRIAYLVMSHTLPEQVIRLLATLRRESPDAPLVLHHDDRSCGLDRGALDALDVCRVQPPSPVAWGQASQLAMTLRCLSWAREHTDFDWTIALSGQDYPIRPLPDIEHSLAGAPVDAFIETRPVPRPPLRANADEFAARYHFRWRRVPRPLAAPLRGVATRAPGLIRARAMPDGTWVGLRALRSPFGTELVCHRGSDWYTLSRRAVEVLERFEHARPDVLAHYRRTLHPTESFVQTALANEASLRLSGDYRRYVVFAPCATGPRVLRLRDLDAMLESGGDFARKFDERVDRAVLDELDRRLHTRVRGDSPAR